jgi:CDGSH-type Zn-finger protein
LFPNGPLLVRGDVELVDSDGAVLLQDTRIALCRCGLSANKPLCDGSHDGAFDDAGTLQGERLSGEASADGPLRIQTTEGGPLLVEGPVTIEAADGATCTGRKGALCRCGASGSKPFCDGSHNDVDFTAA